MIKNKTIKILTIFSFLLFITIFPIISVISEDKVISALENKILTQMPKLELDKIKNGSFMRTFDEYVSDQFPFRKEFIFIKNNFNYSLGTKEFRNIYVTKSDRLVEKFVFNKENIDKNISRVNNLTKILEKNYNLKSTVMVVPTSIAFYDDELYSYQITDSIKDTLNYIEDNINNFYTPFNILNKNKDKYIYFNTDHHWTQLGARLAYNDLYNKSNDLSNYEKVDNDFYGTYYSKAMLSNIKGDSIYSFKDFNNFNINVDNKENYDTLYDDSKLNSKNKYQYFLHGDPAFALINGNEECTKEILVIKDSFAHNFIPFLTSDYNKIHVIDPRYYNKNIVDYVNENNDITEVLFVNNIQSLNNDIFYK